MVEALCLSLHDGVDIAEVASFAIVVQTVTHDKLVGDFKAAVRDVKVHFQVAGFDEQRSDADFLGIFLLEQPEQLLHGQSRIDNVFHDNHGAVRDIFFQSDELADLPG